MRTPKKAVILAAGYGTRMLPLSLRTPKPILPLWGKPVLGHTLAALYNWGVKSVLINLHHLPSSILEKITTIRPPGMKLAFSFEPEIMGTGGALKKAGWFLDQSAFWLVNGDILFDLNQRHILEAFSRGRHIAALLLNDQDGPRTVEMKENKIVSFKSRQPGSKGTYTFTGIQLLSTKILEFIPEEGFSTIIDAYISAMTNGHPIVGLCPANVFWADLGTPESYIAAHRRVYAQFLKKGPGSDLFDPAQEKQMQALRESDVLISGFLAAGKGVKVARGARVSDSVLFDNVSIARGSTLQGAIVAENVHLDDAARSIAIRADDALDDQQIGSAIRQLGWEPKAVTLVYLEPRGSGRDFIRLIHGKKRAILIRYSPKREENTFYAGHALFLQTIGWPVPEVIRDDPGRHLSVMEDLGDCSLQRAAETMPLPEVIRKYIAVIEDLRKLHRVGSEKAKLARLKLAPPFTSALYRWERGFFERYFLKQYMKVSEKQRSRILRELSQAAAILQTQPAVLIHRDLQSSNILLSRGRPHFIDFQGMRLGAAAYDLASLLCDPYVELPMRLQTQLLSEYNKGMPRALRVQEAVFWTAAIERLAQALGAYVRLGSFASTTRFKKYILPGARMMLIALRQAGHYPHLNAAMRDALNGV